MYLYPLGCICNILSFTLLPISEHQDAYRAESPAVALESVESSSALMYAVNCSVSKLGRVAATSDGGAGDRWP